MNQDSKTSPVSDDSIDASYYNLGKTWLGSFKIVTYQRIHIFIFLFLFFFLSPALHPLLLVQTGGHRRLVGVVRTESKVRS